MRCYRKHLFKWTINIRKKSLSNRLAFLLKPLPKIVSSAIYKWMLNGWNHPKWLYKIFVQKSIFFVIAAIKKWFQHINNEISMLLWLFLLLVVCWTQYNLRCSCYKWSVDIVNLYIYVRHGHWWPRHILVITHIILVSQNEISLALNDDWKKRESRKKKQKKMLFKVKLLLSHTPLCDASHSECNF